MIEVLVALVVVAIGLLGFLALQTHSLQSARQAYITTMATTLAMDLQERIRNNPDQINRYVQLINAGTPTTDKRCNNACTPRELATHDAHQWHQNAKDNLSGAVEWHLQGSPDQPCTLTARWTGPGRINDPADHELTFVFRIHAGDNGHA